MSSKSCEIANWVLLDAFTRDIGTVSKAAEAGQTSPVSLLGIKARRVLHTRPQRWSSLGKSATPREQEQLGLSLQTEGGMRCALR